MKKNNPAKEALTRAVNKAIANGAPVYTSQPASNAHGFANRSNGGEKKTIKTERVPPSPLARKKLIALKLNPQEWAVIEAKAKKYAEGNVSAFLRYAGINFKG